MERSRAASHARAACSSQYHVVAEPEAPDVAAWVNHVNSALDPTTFMRDLDGLHVYFAQRSRGTVPGLSLGRPTLFDGTGGTGALYPYAGDLTTFRGDLARQAAAVRTRARLESIGLWGAAPQPNRGEQAGRSSRGRLIITRTTRRAQECIQSSRAPRICTRHSSV